MLRFDARLQTQVWRLKQIPSEALRLAQKEGVALRSSDDLLNYLNTKIAQIQAVRASLVDAFPAVALVQSGARRGLFEGADQEKKPQVLQLLLRQVMADCDTAREAVVTGNLHILDVERVVGEVRQSMGIDADEHKKRAIDNAIRQHHGSGSKTALAALLLLFVPGIGPYLAVAAGVVSAAISWKEALDPSMQAAAGAGVREGLISRDEANAKVFWAWIETMLLATQLPEAQELDPALTRIAPHVPDAVDRLAPGAARAAAEAGAEVAGTKVAGEMVAAEVAPQAAMGGTKSAKPFSMTGEELTEFAQRLFKRPVRPMTGEAHFYSSWEEYAEEFHRYWPDLEPPTGGYLNPITGHLHVSPRGNLLITLHEALHKVAHETFPMGRQLLATSWTRGSPSPSLARALDPRSGGTATTLTSTSWACSRLAWGRTR